MEASFKTTYTFDSTMDSECDVEIVVDGFYDSRLEMAFVQSVRRLQDDQRIPLSRFVKADLWWFEDMLEEKAKLDMQADRETCYGESPCYCSSCLP